MWTAFFVWLGLQVGQLGVLVKLNQRLQRHNLLINWDVPRKKLPIIDNYLRRYAGTLNKRDRYISRKACTIARKLVQYEAFDHIVAGLINPHSKWHTGKVQHFAKNFVRRHV